jgi:hypothetical protein
MSSTRSEFSPGGWAAEPSVEPHLTNDRFPSERLSLGKRASRALARFLITFCIGVAATLAWQSYGDAAREMVASSSPQLGWLAPSATPATESGHNVIAPTAPAASSPDQQELNAVSLGLAGLRQSVDQLAASQEQMAGDISKLHAAAQGILDKISTSTPRPAAAPARKPGPPQAPAVR